MASLELRSGRYRIVFRFGGKKYHHSLGTTDRQEAEALRDRARANLHDLANGRTVLPPGADLALFLLSDGRITEKTEIRRVLTLGDLSGGRLPQHDRDPPPAHRADARRGLPDAPTHPRRPPGAR